jgi:hypothetical protein
MILQVQTSNNGDLEEAVYQLLEHRIEFVYGRHDCRVDSVYPTTALIKPRNSLSWPVNFYVKSDDEDLLVWLKMKL